MVRTIDDLNNENPGWDRRGTRGGGNNQFGSLSRIGTLAFWREMGQFFYIYLIISTLILILNFILGISYYTLNYPTLSIGSIQIWRFFTCMYDPMGILNVWKPYLLTPLVADYLLHNVPYILHDWKGHGNDSYAAWFYDQELDSLDFLFSIFLLCSESYVWIYYSTQLRNICALLCLYFVLLYEEPPRPHQVSSSSLLLLKNFLLFSCCGFPIPNFIYPPLLLLIFSVMNMSILWDLMFSFLVGLAMAYVPFVAKYSTPSTKLVSLVNKCMRRLNKLPGSK